MAERTEFRRELGQQLRVDSVRASAAAGSGHPTSSMSAADLIAVLHRRPPAATRDDHLIFSKGHASPLYYAMLKADGAIDDAELLTFRKLGSRLEGHPTPRIPPTDVATGSLGQGLPIAAGIALAGKRLDRLPYRVWCLCGDSEMAEGSMWESIQHAGWEGLDNLDRDHRRQPARADARDDARLGPRRLRAPLRGVRLARDRDRRPRRRRDRAPPTRRPRRPRAGRPRSSRARKKGSGVKAVEDQPGKHGKPLDDPDEAIAELGGERDLSRASSRRRPAASRTASRPPAASCRPGSSARRSPPARRTARRWPRSARSAATSWRSTARSPTPPTRRTSATAHEDRYFEMFIAEQQLVAAAVGFQVRGWVPFASTFAAFLSRAYDFVRMAAISRANIRLSRLARRRVDRRGRAVADGARGHRVAPRDPRLDRAAPERREPDRAAGRRDGRHATASRSCARCAARRRCARAPDEDVRIGGSRIAHEGDDVAIVACGITVDEAVRAAEALAGDGIARPRARLLLDQADRRRGRARGGARLRRGDHGRGPPRPRAGSATRCSRRWPTPTTARRSPSWPCARCPARARRRSCCTGPGIDADAIAAAAARRVSPIRR